MNGFTKIFLGLFWVGCAIYGATHVNPDYSTGGVLICGALVGMMIFTGILFISTGVKKVNGG